MATIGTKRLIREFGVAGAHFKFFSKSFYHLILKKHVLTVSHMTVTLRMMSNNRRSSPVINAHLPIDKAGRNYCSDRRKFEIMATNPVSNITL
jgi:hypothetical protein